MANHKEEAEKNNIKIVFHVNEELQTHINEESKYFDSRSAYLRDLVRKDMTKINRRPPNNER